MNDLTNRGLEVIEATSPRGPRYPEDCGLNAVCIGGRFFHRRDVSDAALKSLVDIIDIRQGYAKCSVCVVDENSVICADKGVAAACGNFGIDVLLIEPGSILLEGFDYGFIGGASFKISMDKLAFTGRLCGHPDEGRIERFLAERGISPVYLTEAPAFDIGSAVLLCESL